ncbi:MAG: hypothetical protein JSS68_14330 [Actinobacteria bacterium]|nr:hypothetical protein [Actinomycetota bacterium]MBS1884907.1 hypothetical protein [Actinomycetota bacterium]
MNHGTLREPGDVAARGLRRLVLACLTLVGPLGLLATTPVAAATRPPIVKACGAIHAKGKRQKVDIAEARGDVSHSCSAARAVMRRFIPHSAPYGGPNNTEVKFRGRIFGCYVSRPDGEGWNYHPLWSSSSGDTYIDYGAGRRF